MPSSSLFLRSSTTLVSLLSLVATPIIATPFTFPSTTTSYALAKDFFNGNFYDNFNFFDDADPTHGFVTYVDRNYASDGSNNNNVPLISGGQGSAATIRVDSTHVYNASIPYYNVNGVGRPSVRIESTQSWTHGLIVVDIQHMPGGICGTWPAFWTLGSGTWPGNGEVDIIEGWNDQTTDFVSAHTNNACTVTYTNQMSGTVNPNDCDYQDGYPNYTGCKITDNSALSFGSGFNNNNGGVYAMVWTSTAIQIYFFPRGSIPSDISNGNPNPSSSAWGQPVAYIGGSSCNIDTNFNQHRIIFDNTFCGDAGGPNFGSCSTSTGYSACDAFVAAQPGAFTDAYWEVNSLKVYTTAGTSTTTTTSSTRTSSSTTTSRSTTTSSSATTTSTTTSTTRSSTTTPSSTTTSSSLTTTSATASTTSSASTTTRSSTASTSSASSTTSGSTTASSSSTWTTTSSTATTASTTALTTTPVTTSSASTSATSTTWYFGNTTWTSSTSSLTTTSSEASQSSWADWTTSTTAAADPTWLDWTSSTTTTQSADPTWLDWSSTTTTTQSADPTWLDWSSTTIDPSSSWADWTTSTTAVADPTWATPASTTSSAAWDPTWTEWDPTTTTSTTPNWSDWVDPSQSTSTSVSWADWRASSASTSPTPSPWSTVPPPQWNGGNTDPTSQVWSDWSSTSSSVSTKSTPVISATGSSSATTSLKVTTIPVAPLPACTPVTQLICPTSDPTSWSDWVSATTSSTTKSSSTSSTTQSTTSSISWSGSWSGSTAASSTTKLATTSSTASSSSGCYYTTYTPSVCASSTPTGGVSTSSQSTPTGGVSTSTSTGTWGVWSSSASVVGAVGTGSATASGTGVWNYAPAQTGAAVSVEVQKVVVLVGAAVFGAALL